MPACHAGAPLASNGWKLASAVCTGHKINIEWQYAEGAMFTTLPGGATLDGKDLLTARSSLSVALQSSPVLWMAPGPTMRHWWIANRQQRCFRM